MTYIGQTYVLTHSSHQCRQFLLRSPSGEVRAPFETDFSAISHHSKVALNCTFDQRRDLSINNAMKNVSEG